MKSILIWVGALLGCALALQGQFVLGCDLPFKAIQTAGLDIDKTCTADGDSSNAAKKAESETKNNFCVTGAATPIEYATFTRLEAAVTSEARQKMKTDRGVLKNLVGSTGEGTLVRFVAFVLDAHVSNKSNGELVNCDKPGEPFNDIHIELVDSPTQDDPCASVAAEMSPHRRPESWSELPTLAIKRPVRVTGPLFFDGSHHPCHDNVRPTPHRISVWEIHPVYQFEVCNSQALAACDVKNDAAWIPLDQWHSHSAPETAGND